MGHFLLSNLFLDTCLTHVQCDAVTKQIKHLGSVISDIIQWSNGSDTHLLTFVVQSASIQITKVACCCSTQVVIKLLLIPYKAKILCVLHPNTSSFYLSYITDVELLFIYCALFNSLCSHHEPLALIKIISCWFLNDVDASDAVVSVFLFSLNAGQPLESNMAYRK